MPSISATTSPLPAPRTPARAPGPARAGAAAAPVQFEVLDGIGGRNVRPVSLGAVEQALPKLPGPDAEAVRNAQRAMQALGVRPIPGTTLQVAVRLPPAYAAAPYADVHEGHRLIRVPQDNMYRARQQELEAARGRGEAVATAEQLGIAGPLTDARLPYDVAVHEAAHLVQVQAGVRTPEPEELGTMTNAAMHRVQQETANPRARGREATAALEQLAAMEGMADSVSMLVTRDWRIGEGYFVDGGGAERDASIPSSAEHLQGAVTNFEEVAGSLAAMYEAERDLVTTFREAERARGTAKGIDVQALAGRIEAAESSWLEAKQEGFVDSHQAGTVVARTFWELQQRVGWEQAERLGRAVNEDPRVWQAATPGFADVVDSMRRHAAVIDPSGGLRRRVDESLAATHLDQAVRPGSLHSPR